MFQVQTGVDEIVLSASIYNSRLGSNWLWLIILIVVILALLLIVLITFVIVVRKRSKRQGKYGVQDTANGNGKKK